MQVLWFFLSVFCGILGGVVVLKCLYSSAVSFFSKAYHSEGMKERNYGRKFRKIKRKR